MFAICADYFYPATLTIWEANPTSSLSFEAEAPRHLGAQQQFSGQPISTAVHCIWRDFGCRPRAASLVPPFAACSAEKEISNDTPIKEAGHQQHSQ